MKEILSKAALGHPLLEILVGSRNHTNIGLEWLVASNTIEMAI